MGHPKKPRKKYEKPKRPYDKDRIAKEKKLMNEFGLRRKREIWKAESILRDFRKRARDLQGKRDEEKEKELINRLYRLGLVTKSASLDDVLELKLEDILSRRLQSIVFNKKIANSPKHARQLIVHGHILINERKVRWPSFLVPTELENKIRLSPKIKNQLIAGEKE
ncbi:MAG: 30S ribosomal protein S4 [Candidatus Aenigmarchaeota archaeon]|nr:30S ribosomal protein S4 [Candidatus Aenigmarchaeota archaeon]OYT58290.1 MAG: 30S ribosomal protein S4 [Candidatus Aenigmarchaeota archaeon ex4484_14]RLI96988.1 MAG: 30S ribosomal protein S4 [Candidatus Aenigmarchaeota archaeon]